MKLNQLIALVAGQKSRAQSALTEIYHKVQKETLLTGISRVYHPKDEDGDRFPSETKIVQYTVDQALLEIQTVLIKLINMVGSQDRTNCVASASIVVRDKTIMADVPVSHLLFLEKQLVDLHTVVGKLPVLDPADNWEFSDSSNCYLSDTQETVKTKKVPRAFVKAEATKEHPAQVETFHEDIVTGYWKTVKFSGAIPAMERKQLLARVELLQDAVKSARESANLQDTQSLTTGTNLMLYLFDNKD